MSLELAWLFASAGMASAVLTMVARRLAPRLGLIDEPDERKRHRHPTPLGGGIAICLAVILVLVVVGAPRFRPFLGNLPATGLLLASVWITALGTLDDRWELRVRHKFLGQLVAAVLLIACGLRIDRVAVFGCSFELGVLAIPLTAFWLLGAANSVNLLDGMDGLASTLALIMTAAVAAVAVLEGQPDVAAVAVVFAGALCGFLLHNLPPARIFLGDGGSLLIGIVLGTLTLTAVQNHSRAVPALVPMTLWSIPILDCGISIVRRVRGGRRLYLPDRAHLHHRLLDLLRSDRWVLTVIASLALFTATASVLSVYWDSAWISVTAVLLTTTALVLCHTLNRSDLARLYGLLTIQRSPVSISRISWPQPVLENPSTVRTDVAGAVLASSPHTSDRTVPNSSSDSAVPIGSDWAAVAGAFDVESL